MKDLYELDQAVLEARLLEHVGSSTWPPVHTAIETAKRAHDGQMRKGSSEPYVMHPLRTALILWEVAEQRNPVVLCAGLLHDTLEDTDLSQDEIDDDFGPQVGDMVRALTQPPLAEGEDRYERNMKYLERLRWEGRDVQIIKSADRLDNVLTMEGVFDEARRAEYLKESREGLLPLTLACNTALYHALNEALAAQGSTE